MGSVIAEISMSADGIAGVRLFDAEAGRHAELERTAVHETPNATHLTFRVRN
ncbi:hypothetical protein [Amycolatopsis plumensis]|uniref:Uncharacterized protein n=1 Tax=Amycolatopsis plumensis TaxID=236508 RepID=A0ABV5UJK8_9PSEU